MTYREVLEDLAERRSEEYINNSSIEHAAVMIEQLFRVAKGKVRILTGHFIPAVYDRPEIRRVIRQFLLDSGNELCAIMISGQAEIEAVRGGSFLRFLRDQTRVKLFLDKCGSLKNCNHFMVVQTSYGYAMRLETDSREHFATGSFNAGNNGERLRELFDRCFTSRFVRSI